MSPDAGFELLDETAAHGAEQVAFTSDPSTGLRAFVAIHSTVLGPGMGGTRFRPYLSERDALVDVLRLARGMTYKHAVCGNDLGGGKAVIIGEPSKLRSHDFLTAYARFVDRLRGRYLTAEDVGTTQSDMDFISTVTPHVTGTSESLGGSGDPSPATAWGVYHAMLAIASLLWGSRSLDGRHVAIEGVGKVGAALTAHLIDAGARVTVADVRADATAALGSAVSVVKPSTIHAVECDIFSPCAMGAGLNPRTIPAMRSAAVCGCANNQLATDDDGDRLAEAGILYAPDFVVNAGGVINIADELGSGGYDHTRAFARVATIEATTTRIFEIASRDGITPARAADHIAEERLRSAPSARV